MLERSKTVSTAMSAALARILVLALPVTPALAAETAPGLSGNLLQIASGLIIVFALLGGGLWLIKRLSGPHAGAAGMKVVGALALSSRERVVLIEVANEVLVVGVSAGGLRTLHTLPAEALHTSDEGSIASASPGALFRDRLNQALGRRQN
ncbi:MAG TPA: flagellar biosynthetic protein FliO [Azoarcus sp.]|nr:flagellar biosynthetic protein FliO [Azoarcus sp.]